MLSTIASRRSAGKARLVILVLGAALLGVLAARAMLTLRPAEELPVLGDVPPFTLTDQTGASFSDRDLAGTPWIATFVYSTCPGPCPRVIEKIQAADRRLSHDPRIRLVSITVDPAADNPEVLAIYGRNRNIDRTGCEKVGGLRGIDWPHEDARMWRLTEHVREDVRNDHGDGRIDAADREMP